MKTCRCFRTSNTVALVHGARRKFTASMIERRDAHAAALFAERGGRAALDVITQFNVVEFADLTVQYEDVTAYLMDAGTLTQAGRERAAVKHALDISARRERIGALFQGRAPSTPPGEHDDLANLTHEQLIDRTTALLRSMLDGRDSEQHKGDVPQGPFDSSPVVDAAGLPVPPPAPLPAPEPVCPYCHQSLTRCAEIKVTHYDAWEVLHYNDPEEVKKRNDKATAEMYESMRRARTGGIPQW